MGRQKIESITPAQEEVMLHICEYMDFNKYAPTIRELGRRLNLTEASIHDRLQQLIRKGYLARKKGSRKLKIIKKILPSEPVKIPVLGEIPAGRPLLEEESITGFINIDAALVKNGSYFALRVRGDSMTNAGINDKDIALIRQQPLARNGNIVAAMLNGEVTLKRLKYRGNEISLTPENPAFNPIPITPGDDFRIIGIMVALNPENREAKK
jgi:repressor LexA